MINYLKNYCLWGPGLPALLLVAACGGTAGNGTASNTGGIDPTDPGINSPIGLPVTGQARYAGFMTLNLPAGGDITAAEAPHVGALSMDVNFSASSDQVSGVADAFRTPADVALSGRLFITDGQLTPLQSGSEAGVEGQISGTLAGPGFQNTVISGTVTAGLSGTKLGAMTGTTSGGVTTGTGIGSFDGSFTAARGD